MSTATLPDPADLSGELEQTPAKHHPHRWRLNRAGIVNVWHYHDNTFAFSGGRMILRGTNGSGKSRALEMLLPFLLDADRRKMDATLAGKVRFEELMKAGGEGQVNRLGYLWLELERTRTDDEQASNPDAGEFAHLTLGALVRFSTNTSEAKVWYFTTDLRVGHDLILLDADRQPLSRDKIAETIGGDRITDSPEQHRERVRTTVFGLTGNVGKERFTGLIQLLHTLRSPDVGNRINGGGLPQILSDALPPLSETALKDAGDRLDGLSETRAQQRRMEQALKQIQDFLDTYRRYATATLSESAGKASSAASSARRAERDAAAALAEHTSLHEQYAKAVTDEAELEGHVEELTATVKGIKESEEYKGGRDLDDRERRVDGLARAARSDLRAAAGARDTEAAYVDRLDVDAVEVVRVAGEAADQLSATRTLLSTAAVQAGTLLETVAAALTPAPAVLEPVRVALDDDPQSFPRPLPQLISVTPTDLDDAVTTTLSVGEAAEHRSTQARTRLATATKLTKDRAKVTEADAAVENVEYRLNTEQAEAQDAAIHRDSQARALCGAWRIWTADALTQQTLGAVEWARTPVARLLVDTDCLLGTEDTTRAGATPAEAGTQPEDAELAGPAVPDVPDLDDLDAAATDAAQTAYTALTHTEAALDRDEREDTAQRTELNAEQRGLRSARDPEPARAPWVAALSPEQVPLWKALDFAATTTPDERRGLEAALLAAGLLTAVITPGGAAVAHTGQVLLTPDAPEAPQPLTAHVIADPTSGLDAGLITALLARINVGAGHPTWVGTDGAWGHGPLRGRHEVPAARHIGALARAAARATRLAEIDAALAGLDERARDRAHRRTEVIAARKSLAAHVRTAPRTAELRRLRTVAVSATRRAADTAQEAARAREKAEQLRTQWTTNDNQHRSICHSQSLPYSVEDLTVVVRDADLARAATTALVDKLKALVRTQTRHTSQLPGLEQQRTRRAELEADAESSHGVYAREHAEFAALQDSVGKQAAEIQERLRLAEASHAARSTELKGIHRKVSQLGQDAAAAAVTSKNRANEAREQAERMLRSAHAVQRQIALPGVYAAASGFSDTPPPALADGLTKPATVEAFVKAVTDTLNSTGRPVDASALMRATTSLSQELNATFDVIPGIEDDVCLIELVGEGGRQPVAVTAAALAQKVASDAAALTAREHDVFTRFVLGGVGEELGRRLDQARQLIAAMNTSLNSIRTSHGIGVKLRWELNEAPGSPVARIRHLVVTNTAVRRAEENEELITLLRQRVDEQVRLDETAGYATHLSNALDYRLWHTVEVLILGPNPGQERRISSRAKLSQGETRFVSYVTLFAAADAYLSGLQDTDRALRLVLLDDAFAKVDDRTIGELMGLLVKLDIDFAMTGHALWGTYPQVPAIDVYEVRRAEGTSAVTTHVHWDGHSRHLRAAR